MHYDSNEFTASGRTSISIAAAGLVLAALLLLAAGCAPFPPGGPMDRGPEQGHRAPAHEQQAPQGQQGQQAQQAQRETSTVAVRNANGSWTPVTLTRLETGQWRGPKGETYLSLPTEEQLRPAYGLK